MHSDLTCNRSAFIFHWEDLQTVTRPLSSCPDFAPRYLLARFLCQDPLGQSPWVVNTVAGAGPSALPQPAPQWTSAAHQIWGPSGQQPLRLVEPPDPTELPPSPSHYLLAPQPPARHTSPGIDWISIFQLLQPTLSSLCAGSLQNTGESSQTLQPVRVRTDQSN